MLRVCMVTCMTSTAGVRELNWSANGSATDGNVGDPSKISGFEGKYLQPASPHINMSPKGTLFMKHSRHFLHYSVMAQKEGMLYR